MADGFEFHGRKVLDHGSKIVSAGSALPTSISTDLSSCGSSTVSGAATDYFFWASAQLLLASEGVKQHGQDAIDAVTLVNQGDTDLAGAVD